MSRIITYFKIASLNLEFAIINRVWIMKNSYETLFDLRIKFVWG